MYITTWSLDDGYGDVKGCNGDNTLLLPSFATKFRPLQKGDFGTEKIDPYSHVTVELNGTKHLVGRGALEQDTKLNWTGGENKHLDQSFPILLFGSLAMMAGEQKNITLAPLVMGLPVKASESEERHETLKRIALGKKHVVVTLADGTVKDVNITVKDLLCKKQPFGSFCDILLDKSGNIANKKISKQFNVVVDIGARTLNVYTLDNLTAIYDLCDTTNDGVYTAYNMVQQFIEEKLEQSVPDGRLPYIINRGELRGIPLKPAINASYDALANIIINKIETLLVNSWVMVDNIIFTGGGSVVMKEQLKNAFAHKNPMFLDRYATARGFYKYGVRHAKKQGLKIPNVPDKEIPLGEPLF